MAYFRLSGAIAVLCLLGACSPSEPAQDNKAAATVSKDSVQKASAKPIAEAPKVSHPPLQIVPEPSASSQNGAVK